MRFLRSLHKWLGLIVGVQLILWTTSGFMFAWLDHHEVMAGHSIHAPDAARLPAKQPLTEPAAWIGDYGASEVQSITLMPLLEEWFWRVQLTDGVELRRAATGVRFTPDEQLVRGLAQQRYTGSSPIASIHHEHETLEAREAGAVWAVRFDDPRHTTLYFSAADGRFVAARNDTWRLFDFFWMLHTMDYRGRDNFNNPLVIFAGTGALWLGLSGIILLFRAFSPRALHRKSLYTALKAKGIELPSNCGGEGTCGLCVVRFKGEPPPPTPEERHLVSKADLDCGYRLACRQAPSDVSIELPESSLAHREWSAELLETHDLTPSIKELRLRVPQAFSFRAGDYVQVEIQGAEGAAPLRRAYSMANAPHETPGEIVLNVRLATAPATHLPNGAGSTFLINASAGQHLRLYGPFGTFHAQESSREMVFIGGGAGMAPIRSLIVDQLRERRATRRIQYWYGARSPQELYYAHEFADLAREIPHFTWHPTPVGHVHEAVQREFLARRSDAAACDWYLCGPPKMLDACRRMLKEAGVPDEQVFFDDFGS